MPTSTLVPLGRAGWGLAIPQLNPLAGASVDCASGVPIITASAPLAIALHSSPPVLIPPSVITGIYFPVFSK